LPVVNCPLSVVRWFFGSQFQSLGLSLVGYVQPLVCRFFAGPGAKKKKKKIKSTMLPQAKAL
jgi:hypothetical protein